MSISGLPTQDVDAAAAAGARPERARHVSNVPPSPVARIPRPSDGKGPSLPVGRPSSEEGRVGELHDSMIALHKKSADKYYASLRKQEELETALKRKMDRWLEAQSALADDKSLGNRIRFKAGEWEIRRNAESQVSAARKTFSAQEAALNVARQSVAAMAAQLEPDSPRNLANPYLLAARFLVAWLELRLQTVKAGGLPLKQAASTFFEPLQAQLRLLNWPSHVFLPTRQAGVEKELLESGLIDADDLRGESHYAHVPNTQCIPYYLAVMMSDPALAEGFMLALGALGVGAPASAKEPRPLTWSVDSRPAVRPDGKQADRAEAGPELELHLSCPAAGSHWKRLEVISGSRHAALDQPGAQQDPALEGPRLIGVFTRDAGRLAQPAEFEAVLESGSRGPFAYKLYLDDGSVMEGNFN